MIINNYSFKSLTIFMFLFHVNPVPVKTAIEFTFRQVETGFLSFDIPKEGIGFKRCFREEVIIGYEGKSRNEENK